MHRELIEWHPRENRSFLHVIFLPKMMYTKTNYSEVCRVKKAEKETKGENREKQEIEK